MSDLEKRLNQIEQKVDAVVNIPSPYYGANAQQNNNDEIDLRELWNVLWTGKWWIIGITFLFAVVGVVYALSLPNMYASKGVYAPSQNQGGSSLGGQLGGLAAIAGVNIGGGSSSNDIDQAMELVLSWPFLEQVVEKNNLKPLIMGVEQWDKNTDKLIWDDEIYDPVSGKWLRDPEPGKLAEPSSYETYRVFVDMIEATYDLKAGMVTIAITYYSPLLAQQWLKAIVTELNAHFQVRDMSKAKKSIAYLEKKIHETSIAEMQSVFYGMIEAQTKTLMLAEVDENYLLSEVVTPQIAELRSSPKRPLIVFVFAFLGGLFSVVGVFIHGLAMKN